MTTPDPMADLAQLSAQQQSEFPPTVLPDPIPALKAEAQVDKAIDASEAPWDQADMNSDASEGAFYRNQLPAGD